MRNMGVKIHTLLRIKWLIWSKFKQYLNEKLENDSRKSIFFTNYLYIFGISFYASLKEISPGFFFGRNDAKDETLVLWQPHAKSWLNEKDSDTGRDWGQEEKGTTEDEMAGWHHHWLDGHESEWTPRVGDGQGGLACCNSWGCKESDMTERLNWTELICDPRFGLSWRMFHVHLRRRCILLHLGGMSWRYQ